MFVPISCDSFGGGGVCVWGGVFCFLKKKKGALIHLKFFVTRVSVSVQNKSIAHSQICTKQQNERLVLEFNASHTQCI